MKALSLCGVVVAIFVVASCTTKPRVSLAAVQSVRIGTAQPREATRLEIKQLVEAYQRAEVLKDQLMGTTPEISVVMLLSSGETLCIAGGGEPFQILSIGDRQINVYGKDLQELLDRFMRESR